MAVSRSVAALCGAAGVALFSLSGAAQAADKLEWSASLTGTSDYVFRGQSQTDNDPTIQGSVGLTYGMFYAGGWASGLDFQDDAKLEVDWYGGVTPTWGMFNFDFGVIWYTYPGYSSVNDNEFLEYKTGVSTTLSGFAIGAVAYWAPEFQGKEYNVFEGSLGYELPKTSVFTPTVNGLVGYKDDRTAANLDYTYWNAGLALAVDNLTFDLRYWDTDMSTAECGAAGYVNTGVCDERFVFTATVSMP